MNGKRLALLCAIAVFLILISGCSEPVILGEEIPGIERVEIGEIIENYSDFADDTVEVRGKIELGPDFRLVDGKDRLLIIPVGLDIPDSLADGNSVCAGIVFYHEERAEPGLAALYLKVRPPRR